MVFESWVRRRNQLIAHASQHLGCLLFARLERHEARSRPAPSPSQIASRIGASCLPRLKIGLRMLRRYQENLMPEALRARVPNDAPHHSFPNRFFRGGSFFEERDHLPTMQFLYQSRLLQNIDPMQLENTLGRIHANTDKLLHGRSLV